MTDDVLARLAEIEKRAADASPGPWEKVGVVNVSWREDIAWLVDRVKQLGGQRILDAIDAQADRDDHFAEAEMLVMAFRHSPESERDNDIEALFLQAAQVHATLALAEAMRERGAS